ncbi:MAG TPA: ABC transporter ATP-binding protein [Thermoleophilaceae bacterium]
MRTDPGSRLEERRAALAEAEPAVVIDHVAKTFRIPHQQYHTLKERMLHPGRSRTFEEFHALRDVDVTIKQGEFFGIVGRNGSGKSTLLKCLAGIYRPDSGTVAVEGRLSPFIELGVGFNPDLAARDNVVINAVMMGLSRAEARRRFDEIIAFAELEEFVDLKLKNYSSGMAVRLGFAVSTQVDAEVLLVDEVLAVGDASFQQKCFDVFRRMKAEGKTILLVTHDMGLVEQFADRAMLIERGNVLSIGDPHEIGRMYNQVNFGELIHDKPTDERDPSRLAAQITGCWFELDGERVTDLPQGELVEIVTELRFNAVVDDPVFGLSLRNDAGHTVFATSTQWDTPETGRFEAGETVVVRIKVPAWFAPSRYRATPSLARPGGGADTLDIREDLASFILHSTRASGGVIDPPHTIEVERVREAAR